MLQYKFESIDAIMDFIMNTVDFLEWEVTICKFSTSNGLNIDMETKLINSTDNTKFIKFKVIYPTLQNFYETVKKNNYNDMNLHIKFRLPYTLKKTFDSKDEYYDFYLNVYCDTVNMLSVSTAYEKSRNSGLTPLSNWDTYFSQLYQNWNNIYVTNINQNSIISNINKPSTLK